MGIYRVDDVGFDGVEIRSGQLAGEDDDAGRENGGFVFSSEYLDALGGGIGALVELAGEIRVGEGGFVFLEAEGGGCGVDLRLGEDGGAGACELLIGYAFGIIAIDKAEIPDAGEVQGLAKIVEEVGGFGGEGRQLFDKQCVQNFKL